MGYNVLCFTNETLYMARWYDNVEEAGFHSFNVIAAAFYEHSRT